MSNVGYYWVRVKTLNELTKRDASSPDEFMDEGSEVYKMFKKYGGYRLKVWNGEPSMSSFYSNRVLDDEELETSKENRIFYENELIFLPSTHIVLDDNLFEI